MSPTNNIQNQIAFIEVTVTILRGRSLIAKDRNIFHQRTTSDPYVSIIYGGKIHGKTKVVNKNVSPEWNQTFSIKIAENNANRILRGDKRASSLTFAVWDKDGMTDDDPMGTVTVPIHIPNKVETTTSWYPVGPGAPGKTHCANATGDLQISITTRTHKQRTMKRGNTQPLTARSIRVGLGWDIQHGKNIDLDTSCVAIDGNGTVLIDETVYYGNLTNSNNSIRHSGDEREGDENIAGSGDDEIITCDLHRVPSRIRALYFILTVVTPGTTLGEVTSALVRVTDTTNRSTICRVVPSLTGNDDTALFVMRLERDGSSSGGWTQSVIEETVGGARDFGSLVPEIKGYSRDIVPGIVIDPKERVAIMRKGGTIRLKDYYAPTSTASKDFDPTVGAGEEIPEKVTLGLAWDVTDGNNIDLDASAVCLDESFGVLDTVSYQKLRSDDGSIQHSGDEREGDEEGDDEKISVTLQHVTPAMKYICFVINSFSGQELDDVSRASCHLFDPKTRKDIAEYTLSNCRLLDKHTALLVCVLYRDSEDDNSWFLNVMSEPAQGKVANDLVPKIQAFLKACPLSPPTIPPEPEIVVNQMPEFVPIEDEEIVVGPM